MTEFLLKSLTFLYNIYYSNKVFSNSNELEDEILIQAYYPGPDEAPSNLNPDVSFTVPTLIVADLAATAINDGGKWEQSLVRFEDRSIIYWST